MRNDFVYWIRTKIPDDEVTGLLLSMMIGLQYSVSADTERVFKELGLLHVLVVSGFQVGLLFHCLQWIFERLFGKTGLSVRMFLSLPLAGIYVQLCCFDPAAVRALVALILLALAKEREGRLSIIPGILGAILICSVIWPSSILELGPQLTFAALLGIALGVEQSRESSKIWQLLLVSCYATFATSSVLALWGKPVTSLAFLLNPTLAPLISFIAGPIAVICSGLEVIGLSGALWPVHFGLQVLLDFLRWGHAYGRALSSAALGYCLALLGVFLLVRETRVVLKRYLLFRGLQRRAIWGEG
jgi:competence protein ComEC